MRRIAYRFLAAIRAASTRVGTSALARPSRAKPGSRLWPPHMWIRHGLLGVALSILMIALMLAPTTAATAETRPHYGGTLRGMLQSPPGTPHLPPTPPP